LPKAHEELTFRDERTEHWTYAIMKPEKTRQRDGKVSFRGCLADLALERM
jgi:hypothetical protein